jgi:hypothetical protein
LTKKSPRKPSTSHYSWGKVLHFKDLKRLIRFVEGAILVPNVPFDISFRNCVGFIRLWYFKGISEGKKREKNFLKREKPFHSADD